MNYSISLCCHPTTTLFVDDNQDFINIIKLKLGDSLCYKFYSSSLKALDFFKSVYQAKPFIQRCFIEPTNEYSDQLFYNVDLRRIHKEIYLSQRFDEIAVAVIDYTMPELDGLELSKQIRTIHPSIRILLLTGEADHEIAVQLFNEGIIDKFIKKDTPDLINVLIRAIKELEHKYFVGLSQTIIDKMNGSANNFSRLSDPGFVNLFNQLRQEKDIIEYYLVDSNGGFLLIDRQGNPYWLAVLSAQELEGFYEYAETEKAPEDVIIALKNKTKLPFFYTDEDLRTPPHAWAKYLHPAQSFQGLDTYYYTLISDPNRYQWDLDKVKLYKDHLARIS